MQALRHSADTYSDGDVVVTVTDARKALHEMVWRLLDAWVDDRVEEFLDVCGPDVTWWLPVDGAPRRGREQVWEALQDVRAGAAGTLRVGSVITADDGSMAVVEMTTGGPPETAASVTSVLTADAGRVMSGRTYVDVAEIPLDRTGGSAR